MLIRAIARLIFRLGKKDVCNGLRKKSSRDALRDLFWWLHRPEPAARSQGEAGAFYAHGTMGQSLVVVPQYDIMRGIDDENAAFADFATWAARLEVPAP